MITFGAWLHFLFILLWIQKDDAEKPGMLSIPLSSWSHLLVIETKPVHGAKPKIVEFIHDLNHRKA